MTGNDLSSILGLRLEDPAQSTFTSQAKMDAINIAQRSVVNMVDNGYLDELESIVSGHSISGGSATFSAVFGANNNPIRGGIVGVFDNTNGLWCTMIEAKDVKRLENSYLSGDTSNAVFYAFKETIYIKPTTVSSIDVWYLKAPTDFVYTDSSASSGGMASTCELNPALYELVLDFAESQLWRMDAKNDRATSAYNSALNILKTLNERYQLEKPQGIGTKGR